MSRIFDLKYDEVMAMDAQELIDTLRLSEGRTVMSETVISTMPYLDGVSNPETSRAFGADLITLNTFDIFNPFIFGYDDVNSDLFGGLDAVIASISGAVEKNRNNDNYLREFKQKIGRFIGVNLEPVRGSLTYPKGRVLNEESLNRIKTLGVDYIVITANPKTDVSSDDILWGIQEARRVLGDSTMIVAGRMHGSGRADFDSLEAIERFAELADVVLLPAPMTVPGVTREFIYQAIQMIHSAGSLAMTAIGTSQEGANASTIEQIALISKEVGADIQHIGDAGISGIALPENIMQLSIAIRGRRHTYRQIARSIR